MPWAQIAAAVAPMVLDKAGGAIGLWGGEPPLDFNVPRMQTQQSYMEGPSLSLSYLRSLMGQQPMPAMPLTNSTPIQKALGGFR